MRQIEVSVSENNEIKKQGDLFGIFFEDLNHAADGGLYGEMVRNRSFEFDAVDREGYHALTAWQMVERGNSVAQVHVESKNPLNENNPHYLVLEVMTEGEGGGIANEGYNTGIPLEEGEEYIFSCYCRLRGKGRTSFQVRLEDKKGQKCYARDFIDVQSGEWARRECHLKPGETDYSARLVILSVAPVCMELDMVSLFPVKTFRNRKNGLRRDIAEMISDMRPRFMRFPGGCLTHIGSLDSNDRCGMYRWKNTIGSVEHRPARRNIWNYNQTLGLGFYEFFLFCEDIGAEPLPVISAGYDPHFLRMVPLDEMQEWIDEALDLIEFANGSPDTKWGSIRSQMGHPESFGMKYLGIGNEEVGDGFFIRYEMILNAVKETYPEIQVISSAGPGSAGSEFAKGWKQAKRTQTSYVDEHFYQCPEWFIANADRYKDYDAEPKAFLGEYASHDDTWFHALSEAAFMIGMEKASGIGLACYAPMLNNVDYSNWKPTLLYYDNHRVYGSACYYVQKLFMNYCGKALVETDVDRADGKPEKELILTGGCRMRTENAKVSIREMCINNDDTKEQINIGDFMLSEKQKEKVLPDCNWGNYSIFFRFCKETGGTAGNLNGKDSFRLDFARADEDNLLFLCIDGWQRLTSLNGVCHGKGCDMGLYHFITERNQEYACKVVVRGANVQVFLNGVCCIEHTCRLPEPDEIYVSAVKDEEDAVIVKLVNLQQDAKNVHITMQEPKARVQIISMSGYQLTDRNSFEETKKVSPKEEWISLEGNELVYSMQGYFFGVMRFFP